MDDLGYTPTKLGVSEARGKAKSISSQVYDMIGVMGGKVTRPGPRVSLCDEDPDHLYKVRHTWSVYGVSEEQLKEGFERLRSSLPENGWKVVQYGRSKNAAKTLGMTADSKSEPFAVNADLWVTGESGKKEENPAILVNVVSGCLRAPDGVNLHEEY
ncbi:hypothetical protein C3486_07680 [Streptomyces sp. Ru73]|nr:hypothetical protein C3486_07680 [Streptomyces sp. Ru73]